MYEQEGAYPVHNKSAANGWHLRWREPAVYSLHWDGTPAGPVTFALSVPFLLRQLPTPQHLCPMHFKELFFCIDKYKYGFCCPSYWWSHVHLYIEWYPTPSLWWTSCLQKLVPLMRGQSEDSGSVWIHVGCLRFGVAAVSWSHCSRFQWQWLRPAVVASCSSSLGVSKEAGRGDLHNSELSPPSDWTALLLRKIVVLV